MPRSDGYFKSGYDERRWTQGPRPRKSFEDMVREHTETALNALVDCVNDKGAHWRERRESALAILAHGHGQPVARTLMAQVNAEGLNSETLSNEQLAKRVNALLSDKSFRDTDCIDGEVVAMRVEGDECQSCTGTEGEEGHE